MGPAPSDAKPCNDDTNTRNNRKQIGSADVQAFLGNAGSRSRTW